MSISSVSSIVTKGGRDAAASDIPYVYYTFDVADVTDTSVLNRTSTFYDASLYPTRFHKQPCLVVRGLGCV